MHENHPVLPCAATPQPFPRRLHAPDAIVIIMVVLTAAALTASGLSAVSVLQLLAGAGLVAILLVGLGKAAPSKTIRIALGAATGPAA
ncbi:hypothetical protein ABZY34_05060 [Streptomyces virginiae]|uniref:hypothetical protein n=1 Tax=Streptomyces virginiae TaxID=1961 RepID=UPI00339E2B2C